MKDFVRVDDSFDNEPAINEKDQETKQPVDPVEEPAAEPAEQTEEVVEEVQEETPEASGEEVEEPSPDESTEEDQPSVDPTPEPEPEAEKQPRTLHIGDEDVPEEQVLEVLSKQDKLIEELTDRTKLLEEIESNEGLKNFIEHWKNGGDPYEFADSQRDWSKVPDIDLLRQNFESQFKGLEDVDKSLISEAFKEHLRDKYKFDPDNEEEFSERDVKIGKLNLLRDAKEIRNQRIEHQKKFQIAKREIEPQGQDQQTVDLEEVRKDVENQPETKSLISSKMVKVNDINFEVKADPNKLIEMTVDGNKFFEQFKGDKGIDYAKWYEALAYVTDPEGFKSALIDRGKVLEREAQMKDAKKLDKDQPSAGSPAPKGEGGLKEAIMKTGFNFKPI